MCLLCTIAHKQNAVVELFGLLYMIDLDTWTIKQFTTRQSQTIQVLYMVDVPQNGNGKKNRETEV